MVISSFIITIYVLSLVQSEMFPIYRVRNSHRTISDQEGNLFLSSAYALFLPLMSYMFSQAKQHNPEGRAQQILIWMVLIEIIRLRNNNYSTRKLQKMAEQLVRLLWVGFLVYSYTPLHGIRVSLFILCIYFAVSVILKGILFSKAKNSNIMGKNTKVIHNYVKRVILQDDLKTTPMNSCDYFVMGEENHEVSVCSNGYLLGKKKSSSDKGLITIGRVFQLNSSEDEVFTSAHPDWRDTCLSFSLAKMLRRRFAKLPVDEGGCKKALDFVLEGIIDYIGSNGDIQTNTNDGERNPIERVFSIMQEELKFVSDFLHIKVTAYHYFVWHIIVDLIGVNIMFGNGVYLIYTISKRSSAWLYLLSQDAYTHCFFHAFKRGSVVVKIFSRLDLAITILLVVACIYIQYTGILTVFDSKRWSNIEFVAKYIKDPTEWNRSYSSLSVSKSSKLLSGLANYIKRMLRKARVKNVKEARVYSSVFDAKVKTILFSIEVDVSSLARFPKWIRKKVSKSSPIVVQSTNAKETILKSLRNSGGRVTNGETSLKNYGMEHLSWACQPNGSTTEAILVWHIATILFQHQELSPQKNNDPLEESAHQQNNNQFKKEQESALALSSYCLYLVAYLPELLPDEVDWTKEIYESLTKEILAIAMFFDQKPTKTDHCNYVLHAIWGESSVVGKGAMLVKDLMKYADDGAQVWMMLADFWAEMMLFITPSDNVEGHQKILDQEELITQLWALLTHAGIVTRPKPIQNQKNESESNAVTGYI
ncbi:uncharacterized protein LOC144544772 [Carex rostrata]